MRSVVKLTGGASQLIVGSHGQCRNLFSPSTQMAHDAKLANVLTDAFLRNPGY